MYDKMIHILAALLRAHAHTHEIKKKRKSFPDLTRLGSCGRKSLIKSQQGNPQDRDAVIPQPPIFLLEAF